MTTPSGLRRAGALSSASRLRLLRELATIVGLCIVPGAAFAAVTVKGKTVGMAKLMNPVWNEAKDTKANRFTFREPSPTVRPDVRNLTGYLPKELCVAALSAEKATAGKVPLRVIVAGGRTTPVTLVVAEGQQVQFENHDPFPHKLYEVTGKGGFGVGEMLPTKSRSWTAPGAGKYEFRDQSSPSIRSWIVVEPRAVAVGYPDRGGNFGIELEPGAYKLRGYFNGEPVGKELDIVVRPGPAEQPLSNPLTVGDTETKSAADAGADGGKAP